MKSTISNVPYSEVLSLEEKKKLEAQLKEVEILDLDKSMQAYISAQLTDSEMRTFQKLEDDYSARGKINRLAKKFQELETIPKEFQVKDITQTPIAKSLNRIQELIQNYQELALLDTDTSQKSHEYFTNITDELKTFDNETKLKLIEKMLPDLNTAIWRHSKFNPQDNTQEYKRRWKELKNSLKARITGYKEELRKSSEKSLNIKNHKISDLEGLSRYFKPQFKGMGNNAINYFKMFTEHLKEERTAKAYAQIALMCYNGEQMNSLKPKTFKKWYEVFCEMVGCAHKTYDNMVKLDNSTPNELRNLFSYLN